MRYAAVAENPAKSASARGSYLRVSFKNTRETIQAINGWELNKALTYLENVKEKKQAIPFRRFAGSIGRTGQGKEFGVTKARWPIKSVEFVEDLLNNAKANADTKGLDTDNLIIKHIQVNRAPKQRRRTYRAHGRISPYQSNPSHIEIILVEQDQAVPKAKDNSVVRLSSRQKGRSISQKKIKSAA